MTKFPGLQIAWCAAESAPRRRFLHNAVILLGNIGNSVTEGRTSEFVDNLWDGIDAERRIIEDEEQRSVLQPLWEYY